MTETRMNYETHILFKRIFSLADLPRQFPVVLFDCAFYGIGESKCYSV